MRVERRLGRHGSRAWNEHSPGVLDQLNARTPLRRAADPDEIAQAAAWLLSDRASWGSALGAAEGARGLAGPRGMTSPVVAAWMVTCWWWMVMVLSSTLSVWWNQRFWRRA